MPASFYPYDTARHAPGATPSRAALGLPERAFVLCGFTRVEKIEPRLFERWLDLLMALPDAVLWLGPASSAATAALRTRAIQRGLDAERLVFVERVDHGAHLARHRAADLFLDTWTFNAHTTGLDALQAGLPLVTLKGAGWSGRYGASLLTAVGLEELITHTPEDYCELVVALAADRPRLRALRLRLEKLIRDANPFAPERMAAHLGAIFSHVWQRHLSGAPPADFSID
jgi:predicted O-linked N-acetylglucosamine transferase (SPINDLY family)